MTDGVYAAVDGTTVHPSQPVRSYATLVDLLRSQSARLSEKPIYRFLLDGETEEAVMSYADLDLRARAVGALLQQQGATGQRVLLLYPPGLEYIAAFFGCLYAGAVAVPAYPPNPMRLERTLPRLKAIVSDAAPTIALTTEPILMVAGMLAEQAPEFADVRWFATDTVSDDEADHWREPAIDADTLAFLQYTSGSTSTPKGVMLSHGNLLHNSEVIQQGFGSHEGSRGVFWLPFYHDMGLIGGLLQPIYCGGTSMLMSPVDFMQRPIRWLQAISRFKATISGGPNFAYDLCVRKVTPEQLAELDLSSWEVAFNGAEPIRADSLQRFADTFAPAGFRRSSFYPCYGLAEATLMVSGVVPNSGPQIAHVVAEPLTQGAVVTDALLPHHTLVGSGPARQQVAIVHPDTLRRCGDAQVGEIWVASGSVAQGYWNQPEATVRNFHARIADAPEEGPFLRTGDMGFLHDGELFVTGRIKDLIIIRGRNHYPQDIELTVEQSHPALRQGAGAAVSVDVDGEERLVVVQEVERQHRNADVEEVADAIRQAVAARHELHVYAVVLLRHGSIPKTSSGKIQRHASKAGFLDGSLETIGTSQHDAPADLPPALDRETLLATAEAERPALLVGYVQAQIARALRTPTHQISADRPISTLGLDSLMAVELQHTLESELGVVLSMVDFLQDSTIAELAAQMAPQIGAAPQHSASAAPQTTFPLSPGQRALWFLHQLAPQSAAYNIPTAVQVRGPVDVPALHRSLQRLSERHPALRTTFHLEDGLPVQHVHDHVDVAFARHDASAWSSDDVLAWLQDAAQQPFDLAKGPLVRYDLLTSADDEHVLLVTFHHIISDLWSLMVLTQELRAIYPAERDGTDAALPAPHRYSDYVHWQAELLQGTAGERLWQHWQEHLRGVPTALDLPLDRPRPPVQTYHGAVHQFAFDATLTRKIKALAELHGATLYTVLLAAFEALLFRVSGQDTFLIGTPTAGRSRAEFARTAGYFVNSVVLQAGCAGQPSFAELVRRTRQETLTAFAHQELPFVTLVERLQHQRDLSRSPLFQVMFALQKAQGDADVTAFAVGAEGRPIDVGGLSFAPLPLPQRFAQFDLSLAMGETADGLAATLEYNTDLFDGETAARMARQLHTLLSAALAAPEQPITDLPLMSEGEREQVLHGWNNTAVPLPAAENIHGLIATQAYYTPDALAVVAGAEQISYGELERRATTLAHLLVARGVAAETPVAICAERSVELLVGILAVLKAGGAYVPLDPTYPADRLAYILGQTGAPLLLTQTALAPTLPASGAETVLLDGEYAAAPAPLPAVARDQTACIIYTSGSTGQPKGVTITHRGLLNLVTSFARSYAPTTDDRMLPLTALASASFLGEILPPLCAGSAVVLPTATEMLDFEALYRLIRQQRVTMLSSVPSLLARLNARAADLPALRLILSGGEGLTLHDIDQLVKTTTIANGYGLTETTVCSTFAHIDAEHPASGNYLSIGRPLINTQAYLLDDAGKPVPVGIPGELYIGGEGLARGYLGDAALTAARFVPSPFAEGQRLYRTGDRARWLPDGQIAYLGRADHQIKIRGFRIEPGEIEAVLGSHPAIREAAVIAREDTPGDKRLVAYVVPQDAASAPAPAQISGYVRERLPAPMVPSAVVLLDALPLTSNGKVDVRALPAPATEQPDATFLAPQSDIERTIATVWQQVLGREHVGIHDNFFDIGGHSLLLVQVHTRLQQTYSQLTLVDLFRHPTISTLAAHLNPAQTEAPSFAEFEQRAQKQKAFRDRRKELAKGR